VIELVLGGYCAFWLAFSLWCWNSSRYIQRLPAQDSSRPVPSVTVIVAARDEAARIESSLRQLLAQRDVELELIVVDDRSEDDTPAILQRLAGEDSRLRPIRVDELPEGWLGKSHACHLAAAEARGEWLLLTDGDAWMKPDLVRRAIDAAIDEGVDHLCLAPAESHATLFGQAALLNFAMGLLMAGGAANRDYRWGIVGVGAFNLVRATAYHDVGGHQALRLAVVEDLGLSQRLRRRGYRSRLFHCGNELLVDWAPTASSFVRALEKNFFALFQFRTGLALAFVLFQLSLIALPLLGVWHGGLLGWLAALAPFSLILPSLPITRWFGWNPAVPLLAPFFGVYVVAALIHSMTRALMRGGIVWRDTFYSLETLRKGATQDENR